MLPALYEIANEYKQIFDELKESGENGITPLSSFTQKKLDAISASLEQKASNVAKYINGLKHNQQIIDDEISRLQKIKEQYKKEEEALKVYLENNMRQCEISKIETPLFKIQFRKCPPKVEIISEKEIPDEYKITEIKVSIDKIKIRNDMKLGVIVPGAIVVQDEKIEIK